MYLFKKLNASYGIMDLRNWIDNSNNERRGFMDHGNIVIYKDNNGLNNIEVKMADNDVWLNQEQLVELYNSSKSNISEHIKHIFEEQELEEDSVVRNFRTVASNGKTYNMKYYNLDMIVAIGFRVKSNIGTNFRIWANEGKVI